MPSIYSRPDYGISPDTLALYTLLIFTGEPLEIEDFTEFGAPMAGYVDRRNPESPVFHGLVIDDIDDGCWELVAESAPEVGR